MDGGVIGEFLVVCGVGSSMEGVGKCGGRCEKRCGGEMWGSVLECGRSEGRCRGYGILYPFFPTPPSTFSSPPHISPFLPPHFSTPQHISPHLLPHFLIPSIFPPYLSQLPKLLKISQFLHHPYSFKLPQILYTPSFFPILHPPVLPIVTLSFTPHQNFSLFSVIAKLVQQLNTLETLCKFHKKNIQKQK